MKLKPKDPFKKNSRAERKSAAKGNVRLNDLPVLQTHALNLFLEQLKRDQPSDADTFMDDLEAYIKDKSLDGIIGVKFDTDRCDFSLRNILSITIHDALLTEKITISLGEELARCKMPFIGCYGVQFYFRNIVFDNEFAPAVFEISLHFDRYGASENTLIIENCDFASATLNAMSFTNLKITRSTGLISIKTSPVTQKVTVKNSVLDYISLLESIEHLNIINSEIDEIDQRVLFRDGAKVSLHFIAFDRFSSVNKNAYSTYKNFRTLAARLGDKIQTYILYAKELDAFRKTDEVDLDSKALIIFSHWLNSNGLSFIKPIFWLIGVNFVLVLTISGIELYTGHTLGWGFLWHSINYLPITSITDHVHFFYASQAIDGLRRILLSIVIYLIISSALRFKFKF
jgi:hypothetical protein